jgi:hypothetical protein
MGLSRQTVSCFGRFVVHQKYDRTGHNSHTGESLTISARKILIFKQITFPTRKSTGTDVPVLTYRRMGTQAVPKRAGWCLIDVLQHILVSGGSDLVNTLLCLRLQVVDVLAFRHSHHAPLPSPSPTMPECNFVSTQLSGKRRDTHVVIYD